ncbi:MAG TPA: DUF3180 family protein [Actinomycetaceae bacterium]|nr:DUF3180 family protein [Actinomycetaceae bacterium]
MTRTSWQHLLLIAVGVGGPAYLLLSWSESQGNSPLPVPGLMWAAFLILAALLLWLGNGVRRLAQGEPTSMDLLRAARVAVLAKACALAAAGFVGYFIAQLFIGLRNTAAPALRDHAVVSAAAAGACLVLLAVALLVEWWCTLPPDDEEESPA